MLRSNLFDFSDADFVVKGTITVARSNDSAYHKKLAIKNNAPLISCISKFSNILIDNVEGLDIAMSMYNLLEYTRNYSKVTGSFWN